MKKWSKDLGQYQDERETGISNIEQTTEANTRWVVFWVPSYEQWLGSVGVAVTLWWVEPVDIGNEEGEERRVRFCGSDG